MVNSGDLKDVPLRFVMVLKYSFVFLGYAK